MSLSSKREKSWEWGSAAELRIVQPGPSGWEPSIRIRAFYYGSVSHLLLAASGNGFLAL